MLVHFDFKIALCGSCHDNPVVRHPHLVMDIESRQNVSGVSAKGCSIS